MSLWSLRFVSYCGLASRLGEGSHREMLAQARRKLDRHRDPDNARHTEVLPLGRNRWEICEPQDCMLVPDWCGVLSIIPAAAPSIDGE